MKKGKLIVIDGTDGSGKATQVKLLIEKLTKLGISFEVIDFPRYEDNIYGELAGRYLKGEFGGIKEVSPYLASLTYAGDRLLAKPQLEQWLNEGKIVISNRYTSSNKAHMSANISPEKREEFMKWLEKLEFETNKLPKPDLTLFLNLPAEIGQKNVDSKEKRDYLDGESKDIHEKDLEHLQTSAQIYLYLSKHEPNWEVIACNNDRGEMKSRDEVHEEIVKVLKNKDIL